MPIVARASKMADESDEQYTFYKDAISKVESVYDCTSVEAILFDTADGIDAYNKSQRSGSIFMGIIGLAFTALGVFLVLRNTGVLMAKAPAGGQANAPYNPQQVPQQAPYTPYQQTQIPQQTPYQPTQMPQQPQQYPQQTQTPQQPPYAQSGNFAQPPYPQPGTYEQPQNPNGNNNGVL